MVYSLILFIIIFLAFRYVSALKIKELNPWAMPIIFTLKTITGLLFIYTYTYIYGDGNLSEDAGVFMRESKIINDVFWKSPYDYFKLFFNIGDQREIVDYYLQDTFNWDAGPMGFTSDNRNMLRVQSLIHFFSKNQAGVHMLIMVFISSIGVKQLFLGLEQHSLLKKQITIAILVLLPSAFFWSSGILKEPFLILGIGLISRSLLSQIKVKKKLFLFTSGILVLFLFKPFVLFSIIPATLYVIFIKYLPRRKLIGGLIMLITITTIVLLLFPSQRAGTTHLISRKQFDFNNMGKGGLHAMIDTSYFYVKPEQVQLLAIEGDSVWVKEQTNAWRLRQGRMDIPVPIVLEPSQKKWYIFDNRERSLGYFEVSLINDSFSQLILNIPEAIINTLFRPFITDTGSLLKYPAVIETFLVFLFLLIAVSRRRKIDFNQRKIISVLVVFIITLSIIIGWVTPISGAIVRYRIPVYYGIVMISMILISPPNFLKKKSCIDQ